MASAVSVDTADRSHLLGLEDDDAASAHGATAAATISDGSAGSSSSSSTCFGRLLGLPATTDAHAVLWQLVANAVPSAVSGVLMFASQAITMMYVGRSLGQDALAVFALGVSVVNLTGMSLCIGLGSAIDTLCSQAYGRDPKGRETGVILQRGVLLTVGLALLVGLLYQASAAPLVAVFGPELGARVASFLRHAPAYVVLNSAGYALQRGLTAQLLPNAPLFGYFLSVVATPLANHALTPSGVHGALAALTVSSGVLTLGHILVALVHPDSVLAVAPTWRVLDGAGVVAYVRAGLPMLLAVCCTWWAFELLNVVLVRYGTEVIAGLNVIFSVLVILFSAPMGLATAGSVCVGNALGRNDPAVAVAMARVTVLGVVLVAGANGILILLAHERLFRLYTDDARLLATLRSCVYIVAAFHAGDAVQFVLGGLFKGAGLQSRLPRVSVPCLWGIGLPMAYAVAGAYAPRHLYGALLGFGCAFAVQVPVLVVDLAGWDWVALAAAAQEGEAEGAADAPDAEV